MLPNIVFLHGVGGPVPRMAWLEEVNRRLRDSGHESIAEGDVIDPDYSHAFRTGAAGKPSTRRSPIAWRRPDDKAYSQARDEFELRRARLEERLRPFTKESASVLADLPTPHSPPSLGRLWRDARLYHASARVRDVVWQTVLDALPREGKVVIIGHSLGSVVAVDALKRLGADPTRTLTVECLITIGSPLGSVSELRRHCHLQTDFPYDTVRSWVNVYDPRDIVTGGRSLRPHFDAVLDAPVRMPDWAGPLVAGHSASAYAAQPVVTEAIVEALIGSQLVPYRTSEPAKQVSGMELLLFKMAYAQQLALALPANERQRAENFERARALMAAESAALSRRMSEETVPGPRPTQLTEADFLRDALLHVRGLWDDSQLVPLVVSLASGWPLAPYEVETRWDSKERRQALNDTIDRLRLSNGACRTVDGGTTLDVSDRAFADAALEGAQIGRDLMERKSSLIPAVLVGAGVVALAATGVGLAFAAPAGLAGAAAITATLAAFGPGGMVGGIATLAALTGAGTAFAAAGVATGSAESEHDRRAKQAFVTSLIEESIETADPDQLRGILAGVIAVIATQERLKMPSMRDSVRMSTHSVLARLRVIADQHESVGGSSQTVKQYREKTRLVQRFLNWLESDQDTNDAMSYPADAFADRPTAQSTLGRLELAHERRNSRPRLPGPSH